MSGMNESALNCFLQDMVLYKFHVLLSLTPVPLLGRVDHCVLVGMDDKTDKTAYTWELDVKKDTSTYSIILEIKD